MVGVPKIDGFCSDGLFAPNVNVDGVADGFGLTVLGVPNGDAVLLKLGDPKVDD